MKKIILILLFSFFSFSYLSSETKVNILYEGNPDAKIQLIIYESLTCGHCADFHKDVYPDLKKNYIDKGLVKIEFRNFPLDLAALNASKIAHCKNDGNSEILHFLFDNHKKWVEAAKFLGCDSIRVNAQGIGSREAVATAAIKGLSLLADYAIDYNINVIVENHGGFSSDGKWLVNVMDKTERDNIGTLPDFGNFCISGSWGSTQEQCSNKYDKYLGVREMMPYAKSVSAKTYDFDELGNCIETDFERMLEIVKKSGYKKYISIEYEGTRLSEDKGIRKTQKLLEKIGSSM